MTEERRDASEQEEAETNSSLEEEQAVEGSEFALRRRRMARWLVALACAFFAVWMVLSWRSKAFAPRSSATHKEQTPWTERGEAGSARSTVMAMRQLPQGGFVSGSSDGRLVIWGAGNLNQPVRSIETRSSINSLTSAEDLIVIGESEGIVRAVWASTGEDAGAYGRFSDGPALSLDLSPDRRLILAGGMDGTTYVWDRASRQQLSSFSAQGGAVKLARFLDSETVITLSYTGILERWGARDGSAQGAAVELPVSSVASADLAPDRRTLAVGSGQIGEGGAQVILWDVARGQPLAMLSQLQGEIGDLAFSADGKKMVLCDDRQVGLYDLETQKTQTSGLGLGHKCSSVTFAADGRGVIVGEEDGRVYRFDLSG